MGRERPLRVAAGSLASLAKKKRKQLSKLISQVQQEPLISTSPAEQEQRHSTSSIAQAVLEEVQQNLLQSTPLTTQAVLGQTQQTLPDSTNQETNELAEEHGPSTEKKTRGSTQMQSVHGRSARKLIVLNALNQPIGPTKAVVSELGSFLGTIARSSALCPINILDWRKVPKKTKDDMWTYTTEKYNIPERGKKWVLEAIKAARRRYKSDLKERFYVHHANHDVQMAKRPSFVPESEFKDLVDYWNSEKGQEMAETNKENRKKMKYPHTAGKSSFAIIREEKKKESSVAPTNADIFVTTRKRKPGRVYKEAYENTMQKIVEMERIESQEREESQSVDTFASVMGPEHPGRVRLYGRGVTKTALKDKAFNSDPSLDTNEMLEQRIEERVQQRVQAKFDAEKDAMRQDIAMTIIEQLQLLNPELQLNTDMLRFSARTSGNEVNELVNRPSFGSNNQGVEGEEEDQRSEDLEDI